jgi:hypothetical protein
VKLKKNIIETHKSLLEVHWQVFILVLDSKFVISTVIDWAFSKSNCLSADFNVRIASSSHHLNFKIIELSILALKLDQC